MPKRVCIVGNGRVDAGGGAAIDTADLVIRFNAPSQSAADIGSRTDILFLANSSKSMQAWLDEPGLSANRLFPGAKEIVLPYHPSVVAKYHPRPNVLSRLKGRRADWTWQAIAVFGRQGKSVKVLSAAFYEEACDALGLAQEERRNFVPSSGYLAIRYALEHYLAPEWQVELWGFGWTGWKRHPWERERKWAMRQIEEGALTLA